MSKIGALILAAGESKRMGQPKQILPWENTTLLGHAIQQIQNLKLDHIGVVLGANEVLICDAIADFDVEILVNKNWKNGIGSSISTGIQQVLNYKLDSLLITLADQPLIDTAHLETIMLQAAKNPTAIIATAYSTKNGVPALFPSIYFDQLMELKKDTGARELLNSPKTDIITIEAVAKTIDIDTPLDYQKITQDQA